MGLLAKLNASTVMSNTPVALFAAFFFHVLLISA
jgi:hypothetical protein